MVVPLAGRWVAAAAGIALVLTAWTSVIGTLIVPRPVEQLADTVGGPERELGVPAGDRRHRRSPAA